MGALRDARPKLAAVILLLLVAALAACLPAVARAIAQPALTLGRAGHADVRRRDGATAQGAPAGATLTLSRKRAGEPDFTVVDSVAADAGGVATWTRSRPVGDLPRRLAAGDAWAAASAEAPSACGPG